MSAFSQNRKCREIAGAVGIRTASLHYHFPGKADLGVALAARYRLRFNEALEDVNARTDDARRRRPKPDGDRDLAP